MSAEPVEETEPGRGAGGGGDHSGPWPDLPPPKWRDLSSGLETSVRPFRAAGVTRSKSATAETWAANSLAVAGVAAFKVGRDWRFWQSLPCVHEASNLGGHNLAVVGDSAFKVGRG